MKRILAVRWVAIAGVIAALLLGATSALAAGPNVRVVHASPDAPAVDVYVDGQLAFQNVTFEQISKYAPLSAGQHQVNVVPAGTTDPVVIAAAPTLAADKDYSIAAVGRLANIEPLVLEDNNSAPAAGQAHVRFVHASPDAPAVDIAVKGGPVLFSNISYKGTGNYTPVAAGTYDLEVRPAGSNTVVLNVPGVKLEDGAVYTVWAMGLVNGQPGLKAVASVDRAAAGAAPTTLPTTGGESTIAGLALVGGAALVMTGATIRRRELQAVRVRSRD